MCTRNYRHIGKAGGLEQKQYSLLAGLGLGLKSGTHTHQQERPIMSKGQDKRKESKKPATKTAKEKHQAKKVKQAEQAHREF